MNIRRILLWGIPLVLVAGALAWAYRAPPVEVGVTPVSRGPLEVTVDEEGRTRVRERYSVAAPVAGYVRRLQVHAGDPVRAGQRLFVLEPLPAGALDVRARAEAEARVARAVAAERAAGSARQAAATAAQYAERERGRLRPMFDTGQISRTEYDRAATEADRARAALDSALAGMEVARQELRLARTALRFAAGQRDAADELAVTSPADGVVLDVHREDEGVVAAGQPMVAVGDPTALEIVVDVLSADAVRLQPGMPVRLERWGGDAPLDARLRTVQPTAFTKVSALGVEEQRVEVIADLRSPPEARRALGDGYRVEARFVVWRSDAALRVPHSSLFRDDGGWAVFVAADGRAQRRAVEVRARGVLYAEIARGLEEGEDVITYPDDRLTDGVRIHIRERE